jgi:tetratricopeptide (TPR) repeat protein
MKKSIWAGLILAGAAWAQADVREEYQGFPIVVNAGGEAQTFLPALPPTPRTVPPAATGTVSISRLRHKIPKEAMTAFDKAAKLTAAGKYPEAARELEKAVARDPYFAEAHANLGNQYFRLGRLEEAESELSRAIALDPDSSTAHSNLGILQFHRGKLPEAKANAKRALELSSTNARARYVLGLVLANSQGTRAEGVRQLQHAARTLPAAQRALEVLRER